MLLWCYITFRCCPFNFTSWCLTLHVLIKSSLSVIQTIVSTIDCICNRLDITSSSCLSVYSFHVVCNGNSSSDISISSKVWIINQVYTNFLTVVTIVPTPCQLDVSSSFISLTVTWLIVSKDTRSFVVTSVMNLLSISETTRLMTHLCHEHGQLSWVSDTILHGVRLEVSRTI